MASSTKDPVFWSLGQLWARNCALTPRKYLCRLKMHLCSLYLETLYACLKKLISVEFPTWCTITIIYMHEQNQSLAWKKFPIGSQTAQPEKCCTQGFLFLTRSKWPSSWNMDELHIFISVATRATDFSLNLFENTVSWLYYQLINLSNFRQIFDWRD